MKLWKQWSRKLDGWVERRRRFQKTTAEVPSEQAGQKVPVNFGTTAPTRVPESDKTR
jgi:hypothetical protein